jgi:hypothetical protein
VSKNRKVIATFLALGPAFAVVSGVGLPAAQAACGPQWIHPACRSADPPTPVSTPTPTRPSTTPTSVVLPRPVLSKPTPASTPVRATSSAAVRKHVARPTKSVKVSATSALVSARRSSAPRTSAVPQVSPHSGFTTPLANLDPARAPQTTPAFQASTVSSVSPLRRSDSNTPQLVLLAVLGGIATVLLLVAAYLRTDLWSPRWSRRRGGRHAG